MTTALPLTTAFFLGDVTVSLGGAASNTYRTATDGSDSPPGPKIVTVKSLMPLVSSTGMIVFGPSAMATSWIAVGRWSGSVRNTRRRWFLSPSSAAGTVTARSAVASLVYGSAGCSIEGGSAGMRSEARGDGVEVTSVTNPPRVEPMPPATLPSPPTATYRTATPRATIAAAMASRKTIGRPLPRWIGRWLASRFGPGDRGLTLTGADRGEDGGRGRTWVGRWSRRVVIARDCRTATGERLHVRFGLARGSGRRRSAMVRCVVLWRGRARDDFPSRSPLKL